MDQYKALRDTIDGDVVNDEATRNRCSQDASLFRVVPEVVVRPKNADDVRSIVRYVAQRKRAGDDIAIAARSGGTGMSGGSLTEHVLIDCKPYFNRIYPIDLEAMEITVEPGAYYHDMEEVTYAHRVVMPSYPASKSICCVGGMVGNNASGEMTFTYGSTVDHVKRMNVVLADGNEVVLGPLSRAELDGKMRLQTFEGEVYRKLYRLIEGNYDTIREARPMVSKNSSGYFLWRVWDREADIFDLTQLFVGSQGTLGITTEITFNLVPLRPEKRMLVIYLYELDHLGEIVNEVLKYRPESFESYDDKTFGLAVRFFPDLLKQMGLGQMFALGVKFIPEFVMAVTGGVPKLILMAEFAGDTQAEVLEHAEAARAALAPYGVRTRLTHSRMEGEKFWAIRRESFNLLRNHTRGERTAPFIDDIVVNPEFLPEFLPRLDEIIADYAGMMTYTMAGHIGDGNLHIIPLMDLTDAHVREIIPEMAERVFDLVFEYGGSMSGEHNDGIIRTPFVRRMFGDSMYELFEETKRIFDPENIFNPGKKVGGTMEYAKAHMVTANEKAA